MTLFKGCLFVVMLLLSACQTMPTSKPVTDDAVKWRQNSAYFDSAKARLETLNRWRYAAKVGINSPALREVANIVWGFSDQANNIRLFGPLGLGAVNLQFDQYGVVLSDNSGVQHRGNSAQELLTTIVGWPIPIDALTHWLHVLPNPGSVYRYQLNAAGTHVTILEQLGWKIEYSSYRLYGKEGSSVLLPRKMMATKILPDDSKLTIKLITKSWELNGPYE